MEETPNIDEGLLSEMKKRGVFVTSLQELYNWGRKNSLWPLPFGTRLLRDRDDGHRSRRYDLARFGAEVFRASPRQADLMIVAGTRDQENGAAAAADLATTRCPSRKYVHQRWAPARFPAGRVQGQATPCSRASISFIPVDVYIPGCPPRPGGDARRLHGTPAQDRRAKTQG
jgi:NADH-quinone oxidoreductase subunit B